MDFVTTLQTLEDAIYEIVTWILFVPKTFVTAFARPGWIRDYVSAEFEKAPNERFTGFLSPVRLWLIVAVVPYAATSLNTDASQLDLQFSVPNGSILVSTMILLMIVPLWFAFVLLWLKRLPVEREALKRLFYVQAYPAAVFELLTLPMAVRIGSQGAALGPALVVTSQVAFVIGAVWFLIAEMILFKQELAISWWAAIWGAGLATIVSLLILVAGLALYVVGLIATGVIPMPGT